VRRVEDQRAAPVGRIEDLKRRIEFVVDYGHVECEDVVTVAPLIFS
jgi:hypothetical protein